jgi:hypothetical protein
MSDTNKKRTLKEFYVQDKKADLGRKRAKLPGPDKEKPISVKEARSKSKQ